MTQVFPDTPWLTAWKTDWGWGSWRIRAEVTAPVQASDEGTDQVEAEKWGGRVGRGGAGAHFG